MILPSLEMLRIRSVYGVFIPGPRFTGSSHLAFLFCLFETQMSSLPCPPGRVEVKKRVFSSLERTGTLSSHLVFMGGPIFTGADHSVKPVPLRLWALPTIVADRLIERRAKRTRL